MKFLHALLRNHVLANLVFVLVLVLGAVSYGQMPRAKDPQIKLNWVNIITYLPGAAAEDVEKRVTDPIEEAIQRSVRDIKFVSSTSREGTSNIIVRFDYIDEATYDKRVIDLRREVQNVYNDELPDEAEDPVFYELTSSTWFPTATVVVHGRGQDDNLRRQARYVKRDLEALDGVDAINALGLPRPELVVEFDPARLIGLGITPGDLADTVRAYFRDVSAGDIATAGGRWLVRISGTSADPETLAGLPVTTARGVVELGALAAIRFTTEEPDELVSFNGQPATMLAVTKEEDANVIDLVGRLQGYIDRRNALVARTGVELFLVDDQTVSTREALDLMQANAAIGLAFVLLVTWVFLGSRVAFMTSAGIPFTLAATFVLLNVTGMTLNNTVLLGVVIALGMLVDDAVVVVETIYERLLRGEAPGAAAVAGLVEVFAPVTTSVLTTVAAFLPLALLPGVLGEFMRVIPIVVSAALALSLLEAYWMLPAHVIAFRSREPREARWRERFKHAIRLRYTRLLVGAMRRPWLAYLVVLLAFALAAAVLVTGHVRVNFFQGDAVRLFYVSVEMPPGTALEETSRTLVDIERRARTVIEPHELRGSVVYAGQLFTETDNVFGDVVGQILVSLEPARPGDRHVFDVADAVEDAIRDFPGPKKVWLLRIKDGPPTQRPIKLKVRGDNYPEILEVVAHLQGFLESNPVYRDIALDYRPGNPELVLRQDGEAIKRVGVAPTTVSRAVALNVDGELVTEFQYRGEEVRVRVRAASDGRGDIDDLLRQPVAVPGGGNVALGELVTASRGVSQYNIRHHDYKRAVTLEADIDTARIDTVTANRLVLDEWQRLAGDYPNIDIDFSGELDDIEESLDAITLLFVLGVGLMYIILGTQFRSYGQPLLILFTVPLAFTGVVLGLLVTGNPLSLYTLYGMVALAGIAVNSSIVLISAANDRLEAGMSLNHATIYAARRRVVPILITSATTIAGLFSLAAGLAGRSFIWGPVATAIVWGLTFSTILTLLVIPMLYRTVMGWRTGLRRQAGNSSSSSQFGR
ncbi:MAG: efflux RND transporter permease subunit [Gammaproteobacteria bacterium]